MTGTQVLQELEEESRNSQYVYDYYYLKGVAVGPGQNDGTDAAFAVNQSTIKVEKSMSNALAGPSMVFPQTNRMLFQTLFET